MALAALVAGIWCWAAAPAAAMSVGPPGGFRLQASNGYSIHVLAFDGDRIGKRDALILFVKRKGASAVYFGLKGAEVTETAVTADLGKLGSIDLHFVPSGGATTETSECDSQPIEFDSGFYEGHFDFEGEEGFTEAHVTRARGEIRLQASLICAGGLDEGFGGHSPGARLTVRRRWESGKVELEATENSPTRPARFEARIGERHDGLAIEREVSAVGSASAFAFDVPAQTSVLMPPRPFSGTARFTRTGHSPGHLRGNLTVDFPGHSNVSLSATRGNLVRWVGNPSHPFRLH